MSADNHVMNAVKAALLFLGWLASGTAWSQQPLEALQSASPALYALYQKYPSLHATFEGYAARQGFTAPVERLATVVHELIHVDSAAHQGYFIDGVYYEPYLRPNAWPALSNADVLARMTPAAAAGPIGRMYVRSTPANRLGNVVDEINAYGHVLPLVCRIEPASAGKQTANLVGFLGLAETYLQVLRTEQPREFERLAATKEVRGAYTLIVQRAWSALRGCGVLANQIPARESSYLMALPH